MSVRVRLKNPSIKIRPEDHRLASQACLVMPNGDHDGRSFLSHPHTNNGFFFLLNIKFRIFLKKIPLIPDYLEMRHNIM